MHLIYYYMKPTITNSNNSENNELITSLLYSADCIKCEFIKGNFNNIRLGNLYIDEHFVIFTNKRLTTVDKTFSELSLQDNDKENGYLTKFSNKLIWSVKCEQSVFDSSNSNKNFIATNEQIKSSLDFKKDQRIENINTSIDNTKPDQIDNNENNKLLYLVEIVTVDFNFINVYFDKLDKMTDFYLKFRDYCCVNKSEKLPAFKFQRSKQIYKIDNLLLTNTNKLINNNYDFIIHDILENNENWRICKMNKNYEMISTYPELFYVPKNVSDTVIKHAVKFRSEHRIPVLSYIYTKNKTCITRCSQPLVGFKQTRNIQDEKLIKEIFNTHMESSYEKDNTKGDENCNLMNTILDARPAANALANTAIGGGTENIENYKKAGAYSKQYLNIENIHVVRDSFNKLVEEVKNSKGDNVITCLIKEGNKSSSSWLSHIQRILKGVDTIVDIINNKNSHVLIHCSDGWDRTAQLTALATLCLDKKYRTIKGFALLIEREFIMFGHKFSQRCGHLSKTSCFVDNTKLKKIINKTNSKNNMKNAVDSIDNSSNETLYSKISDTSTLFNNVNQMFSNMHSKIYYNYYKTEPKQHKETSLIFLQFLDCVYQLFVQNPTEFEFNEEMLIFLHIHSFSCFFNSFLFDNMKMREKNIDLIQSSCSVWEYISSKIDVFKNSVYSTNDTDLSNILRINSNDVKYWTRLFCGDNRNLYAVDFFESYATNNEKNSSFDENSDSNGKVSSCYIDNKPNIKEKQFNSETLSETDNNTKGKQKEIKISISSHSNNVEPNKNNENLIAHPLQY